MFESNALKFITSLRELNDVSCTPWQEVPLH